MHMESEPRLLTVAQAAAALSLSPKSIYKLLAANEIRGTRILRDIRIPTAEIDRLVERKLEESPAVRPLAARQQTA
jgi:excisionase family DNA binding protein